MSRISENIRKVTKAWGGKTTGNGISDALSDLYNNLPFGTKTEMVALVPEQSVTGEYYEEDNTYYYESKNVDFIFEVGKKYRMIRNGLEHNLVAKKFGDEDYGIELSEDDYIDTYEYDGSYLMGVSWPGDLGETITLAIYGEKEIITPISYDFMPDGYPKSEKRIVTILPEQTEFEYDDGKTALIETEEDLIEGNEYTVVLNGVSYKPTWIYRPTGYPSGEMLKVTAGDEIGTVWIKDDLIYTVDKRIDVVKSLAIHEEKEIVEQIDPKFVNCSKTRWYVPENSGNLYVDEDCTILLDSAVYQDTHIEDIVIVYGGDEHIPVSKDVSNIHIWQGSGNTWHSFGPDGGEV